MKDKRLVDLTGSPELASCSKGYVSPNTQATHSGRWRRSTCGWRIKAKFEARLRFGSGFMFSFSSHSSSLSVPNKPGTSATHSRDLSLIMRWSAGIRSQSRVSASFSARSRMLPATTGSSALAAVAQLDSHLKNESWIMIRDRRRYCLQGSTFHCHATN